MYRQTGHDGKIRQTDTQPIKTKFDQRTTDKPTMIDNDDNDDFWEMRQADKQTTIGKSDKQTDRQ